MVRRRNTPIQTRAPETNKKNPFRSHSSLLSVSKIIRGQIIFGVYFDVSVLCCFSVLFYGKIVWINVSIMYCRCRTHTHTHTEFNNTENSCAFFQFKMMPRYLSSKHQSECACHCIFGAYVCIYGWVCVCVCGWSDVNLRARVDVCVCVWESPILLFFANRFANAFQWQNCVCNAYNETHSHSFLQVHNQTHSLTHIQMQWRARGYMNSLLQSVEYSTVQ